LLLAFERIIAGIEVGDEPRRTWSRIIGEAISRTWRPLTTIFKPNVTVTGTCTKCRRKHVYVEGDVIRAGQITTTIIEQPRKKK
jgi:hypothetical protein